MDKENRYSEFTIISLPYPGCEFFREFRDNNYSHESLVFDWSQTHVNADIGIPMDSITSQLLYINWDQYKVWDLVTITQNYLKLCLKYLQDNSSGLLIHCIRYANEIVKHIQITIKFIYCFFIINAIIIIQFVHFM